jgi:hypothetical protein
MQGTDTKDRELVSGSTQAFELRQAVRKQLVGVPLLGKAHNLLVDLSRLDGERIRDLLAVEAVGDLGIEEELSRLKSKIDVILLKEQLLDIDVLGIFFGPLGVAGIGRLLLSLLPILMIPIWLLCLQLLLSFLLFLAQLFLLVLSRRSFYTRFDDLLTVLNARSAKFLHGLWLECDRAIVELRDQVGGREKAIEYMAEEVGEQLI